MHNKPSRYIAQIAILAFTGENDVNIAKGINKNRNTFTKWVKIYPQVRRAVKIGRTLRKAASGETFREYLENHMSEEHRKTWDTLHFWVENAKGSQRITRLMSTYNKATRQMFFIHALMAHRFNASAACRVTGTAYETLMMWQQEAKFQGLLNEIKWHKKNFIENSLMDLVAMRETSAVTFANRTINKDRGYGDSIDVNVSGNVNLSVLPIDKLNLSVECRKELLQAMRAYAEETAVNDGKSRLTPALKSPSQEIIDVEASELIQPKFKQSKKVNEDEEGD